MCLDTKVKCHLKTGKMWTFLFFVCLVCSTRSQYTYRVDATTSGYTQAVTEHPGGTINSGIQVLYKSKSPYWLRNDIIIERDAQLVIEPGVEVRFEPMIGITVRGILKAEVSDPTLMFMNDKYRQTRLH